MTDNEKLIDDLYTMGEEIYKKYKEMKNIRLKIIELNKQDYVLTRLSDKSWDVRHKTGFSILSLPRSAAKMFCSDALEVIDYCNNLDMPDESDDAKTESTVDE